MITKFGDVSLTARENRQFEKDDGGCQNVAEFLEQIFRLS